MKKSNINMFFENAINKILIHLINSSLSSNLKVLLFSIFIALFLILKLMYIFVRNKWRYNNYAAFILNRPCNMNHDGLVTRSFLYQKFLYFNAFYLFCYWNCPIVFLIFSQILIAYKISTYYMNHDMIPKK